MTVAADGVSYWARKAREATTKRNRAIVIMHNEGASLRTIAAEAGLSQSGVARILRDDSPRFTRSN